MLTSFGRAAARRILTTRLSSAASSPIASQLLRSAAAAGRPALAARGFTVSARARLPAAGSNKKSTSTKTKAKSSATKKAAKPKKKAPVKKAAAPKKPKKEIDPETKAKLEIRDLKKKSLFQEPAKLPETAWVVYLTRELKDSNVGGKELAQSMKQYGSDFKSLPAYEVDNLQSIGQANKKENEVAYKEWVETLPVERVYLANLARRRLARLTDKRVLPIRDERLPKRPGGPYTVFVKARFSTPGGSDSTVSRMKELSTEWKELTDAERLPFRDLAAADSEKYKVKADEIRARAELLVKEDKEIAKQELELKKQQRREKRATQ